MSYQEGLYKYLWQKKWIWSQETSHSSFQNHVEIVDSDCRGVYRYHTSHSSSYNPSNHVRSLWLSVAYRCVQESVHRHERGDSSCNYGRHAFMYQDTIQYSFNNVVESVDGDGRGR